MHGKDNKRLAEELYRSGNLVGAREQLEKLLLLVPQDAECHNDLGAVLFELGEVESAVYHFQEALRICPQHEDAWANYVMCLNFKRCQTTERNIKQIEHTANYVQATFPKEKNPSTEIGSLTQREDQLKRLLDELARDATGFAYSRNRVAQLVEAWGNRVWGAGEEYVRACILACLETQGPSLECGSGLTTLIAGIIAGLKGFAHWALEHDLTWFNKVKRFLELFGVKSVVLVLAPLKVYREGFVWYDAPLERMPHGFRLVICDGPPGGVPGGRYGLSAIVGRRLAKDCVILLDDAHREKERAIAAKWERELGATVQMKGTKRPYFELKVGQRRGKRGS